MKRVALFCLIVGCNKSQAPSPRDLAPKKQEDAGTPLPRAPQPPIIATQTSTPSVTPDVDASAPRETPSDRFKFSRAMPKVAGNTTMIHKPVFCTGLRGSSGYNIVVCAHTIPGCDFEEKTANEMSPGRAISCLMQRRFWCFDVAMGNTLCQITEEQCEAQFDEFGKDAEEGSRCEERFAQ